MSSQYYVYSFIVFKYSYIDWFILIGTLIVFIFYCVYIGTLVWDVLI